MRISTSYIFNQNLEAMLNQQSELAKSQLQISTGKKILNPSDDPAASVQILNIQREFSISEQNLANADKAENKLQVEEGVLKSTTEVLQKIRQLSVQGLNDTNTQTDRLAISKEIKQLNEQLLAFANTRDSNGDYLFSGFLSNTQPYTSIGSTYSGDSGQRNIQIGSGVLVETNDPGNKVFEAQHVQTTVTDNNVGPASSSTLNITALGQNNVITTPVDISFSTGPDTLTVNMGAGTYTVTPYVAGQTVSLSQLDPSLPDFTVSLDGALANGDSYQLNTLTTPSQSMFQTIDSFANALAADAVGTNNSPNNGDFLTNISAAMDVVINAQANVGSRMNAIEQQRDISSGISLNMERTLSSIQDLDYAEAISKMTLQMTGLQAAQQSFSRVQSLSLLNFI
jgi:flagellar hook-associated protein 3 FlgL